MRTPRNPKRSYIEALLEKHRRTPCATVPDRRQLDLVDGIKRVAFKELDAAIKRELET